MPQHSIDRHGRRTLRLAAGAILLLGLAVIVGLSFEGPALFRNPTFWITSTLLLVVALFAFALDVRRSFDNLHASVRRLNESARQLATDRTATLENVGTVRYAEHRRLLEAFDALREAAREDIRTMKRLEQVRTEFLGNVSHELRTPIFTIQGFLETLIDGAVDDPEVRDEFLQKALANVIRLQSLLNDLIEISHIESGSMKMSFREFDLLDLARRTVADLADRAETEGVHLHLETSGSTPDGHVYVYGDRRRIEQVVLNLIENGIKYNRPGGRTTIAVDGQSDGAVVSVSDEGEGIPAEHLDRIFERFYRVDSARSRQVGGSGLGLAIVKHIVEAHRSRVEVESVVGEGTTFSFRLPTLPE